jgi:hypothetical protein
MRSGSLAGSELKRRFKTSRENTDKVAAAKEISRPARAAPKPAQEHARVVITTSLLRELFNYIASTASGREL